MLHNDLDFSSTDSFFTELYKEKIINNYIWFFNFEKFNPLEEKIDGKFIIGGLPHDIFPDKYSIVDLETTNSYKTNSLAGRSWRLYVNKIYIDNNNIDNSMLINDRIITFNYENYNIITSMEAHNIIKNLVMNELIKENICFCGNFSQNIYKNNNLTFYYCNKTAKDILYTKIPNLKFFSSALNYTFELTKEELFYEKNDYIYFMILFTRDSNTYWIMGQMFTYKYNFVFDNEKNQIGFYKNVYNNNNKNINKSKIPFELIIAFIIISVSLIFIFIGIFLGKLIFREKKKKRINQLEDEINDEDYEYKENEDNTYDLND